METGLGWNCLEMVTERVKRGGNGGDENWQQAERGGLSLRDRCSPRFEAELWEEEDRPREKERRMPKPLLPLSLL